MSQPTPRPGVMQITPYVGGKSSAPGAKRLCKLSSNENPLGSSAQALEAYKSAAEKAFRYPDGGSTALREAIGAAHGLDPARIVCGAGSDELIGLLCSAYLNEGDEIVQTAHGFLMYEIYALAAGGSAIKAPETDLRADVDTILKAVTKKTRLVFIANPNNPTGTYLSKDELARLRAELRPDIILVLDGAYAEYVDVPDYSAGVELVDTGENVVMTRTFSKIYGLAALRLGWAYAPASIADVLNRARSPFNVNSPAQAAGAAAMADQDFVAQSKAHNDQWLAWVTKELRGAGFEVTDSVANFVLVKPSKGDAEGTNAHLLSEGVIARQMGGYGLPDWLRITIGTEDENRIMVQALKDYMAKV